MHAGCFGHHFRGITLYQFFGELENCGDFNRPQTRFDRPSALQCRIAISERQRLVGARRTARAAAITGGRSLRQAVRGFIPDIKRRLPALAVLDVGLAQKFPIIGAHQERQVCLFLYVVPFDRAFLKNDLHHRHCQGRIGTRFRIKPLRRMHRTGIKVRRDGDDFGAVVSRLPEKMRVRDTCHRWITNPDQADP